MRSFQIAHMFEDTVSSLDDIKPTFASVMVDVYRSRTVKTSDKNELINKLTSLEENIGYIKNILKEY